MITKLIKHYYFVPLLATPLHCPYNIVKLLYSRVCRWFDRYGGL